MQIMKAIHAAAFALAVILTSAAGAVDLPNPGFEQPGEANLPEGWGFYNWGTAGSDGVSSRSTEFANSGEASLQADSRDGSSRPGVYTRVPLQPGRYAIRFFARAENGRKALVRAYLADRYSPPLLVTDRWTKVEFEHSVNQKRLNAEINIQHFGGEPGSVWFDDLELVRLPSVRAKVIPDPRDPDIQPKMLYFCGNTNYAAQTARTWVRRGFAGFFHSYLFHDWITDIWSLDDDPDQDEEDRLLGEVRQALNQSAEQGLSRNVLKVAFYTQLPDLADDEAWGLLTSNFREGARFARLAGFRMLAIDTEYVSEQYRYDWEGYNEFEGGREALAAKTRERWRTVGGVLAEELADVDLGILPEGMIYYGPLWTELFAGLLEGLEEGQYPGKVHVFCEGTYSERDPDNIRDHAAAVRSTARALLDGRALESWDKRGRVALAAWPLGYYREIKDAQGKFLGWSGREETFGNEIVGSYADKSARYPVEEFEIQLAAIRTYSDDYCWIYGHGASWWQVTPEQADQLSGKLQYFSRDNYLVPVAENIDAFYEAAGQRNIIQFVPQED